MAAPEPDDRTSRWPVLLAVGGIIVCCAGPALLALAATGGGVAAVRSGPALMGAAVVAALVVAGLVWRRRRSCARPTVPAMHGPHEPHVLEDRATPGRREPTHVR